MIKFRKHNNQNNVEYIRYDNLILPIKSIIYIKKNTRRTFDTVLPDVYYTIYFGEELKYEVNNPFGTNTKEYKLRYKNISIDEKEFNKTLKPLLENKIINISNI